MGREEGQRGGLEKSARARRAAGERREAGRLNGRTTTIRLFSAMLMPPGNADYSFNWKIFPENKLISLLIISNLPITNLSRFSWLFALELTDIRNTNITILFI
jgi:hypothetical protein